jgi:hypothetical protein
MRSILAVVGYSSMVCEVYMYLAVLFLFFQCVFHILSCVGQSMVRCRNLYSQYGDVWDGSCKKVGE